MALLESILLTIGGSVAKYLFKEVLPADWQDEIAKDLISFTVKQISGRDGPDPAAVAIGQRLDLLYQHSSLDENEKAAALIEVIYTLDATDTTVERLVEADLEPDGLSRALIASRAEATDQLPSDGEALYEQMLLEASRGVMAVAHRTENFHNAQVRAQLGRQRDLLDDHQEILALLRTLGPSLASLVEDSDEAALRFENEVYRPALVETLNQMEPFGIDAGDRIVDHLKLTDSFVVPDLRLTLRSERQLDEMRPMPGERGREPQSGIEERRLPAIQALAQVERLMVVGAAGSGKSTFLQWLAICTAQGDFPEPLDAWNRLVPFFIRLRDYQGKGFPTPEQFADRITPVGAGEMPAGWARAVLRRGDGLVLIDGVDEMAKDEREQMLDVLKDLVRQYPLSRYVVSSRPPVVDESRWPEWHDWLKRADFARSRLPEMSWPQIESFVLRWHEALATVAEDPTERADAQRNSEGAVLLLRSENALRNLAASPLLCAMICALYQSRRDYISAERIELYKSCVDMLLWERDRKHRRRKVPALADYPDLSKTHLIRLLDQLAYWMMDENASAVSPQRAIGQFERAFEYFNERASMWDELAGGLVEFRHRSFQEYLAGGWAMREDKLGALAARALDTEWRETIVLAAGQAGRSEDAWALLRQILKQADNAIDEEQRRYLLLLALSCLETCSELPHGDNWTTVMNAARSVFPPHSEDEADAAAKAGRKVIDLLRYDPDAPEQIAVLCIRSLAAIGGALAMAAIAGYIVDERWSVQRAIGDAWSSFEPSAYADLVLDASETLSLSSLPANLDRLNLLSNLTSLDLSFSQVSDLSGLSGLSNLTALDLRSTQVSDVSNLSGLSKLTTLDLRKTHVSDVSNLSDLANLATLHVGDFHVHGLTQVDGTSHHPALFLAYAGEYDPDPFTDLSLLSDLTNLAWLLLTAARVNNLRSLSTLTSLTQLYLIGMREPLLNDLSPLVGLTELRDLSLSNSVVSDLSPLAALSSLAELSLGSSELSDLRPLSGLSNLTELSLHSPKLSNLIPLADLSNLSRVSLRSSQILNLEPLANLSKLTHLDVRSTQVSDLESLARLSRLERLCLTDTLVDDVSVLIELGNLIELYLDFSPVSDVSGLCHLDNLTTLSLRNTQVSDLSGLLGLSNLTQLILDREKAAELLPALLAQPRRRGLAVYTDFVGGDLYRYYPPNAGEGDALG